MRNFIFPLIAAVAVVGLGTLLLTVGARSPYTHANLLAQADPRYTRTIQAVVGPAEPYGAGDVVALLGNSAVAETRGRALLVARGCASCHGLEGRGGTIGPAIVGFSLDEMHAKSAKGPGGMPVFSEGTLSHDELAAIAAYLQIAGKQTRGNESTGGEGIQR